MCRAGRRAVVRMRQGQTWNPGLRPAFKGPYDCPINHCSYWPFLLVPLISHNSPYSHHPQPGTSSRDSLSRLRLWEGLPQTGSVSHAELYRHSTQELGKKTLRPSQTESTENIFTKAAKTHRITLSKGALHQLT